MKNAAAVSPLRIASGDDASAIHAIYAHSVNSGASTFETTLPGVAVMGERISERLQQYPWLVWDEGGDVLAYAYAGRFRERAAYDWIAETSIYVRPDAQGRGIARTLYGALLDVISMQGINQAVGVITLPGIASVAMHEAIGFTAAGVWRQCGYKHDQWWDVGLWQKTLQPAASPPLPMTPFATLAKSPALIDRLG